MSHFQIQYKQKNDFQWKFQTTIQVTNGLTNNLPSVYSNGQHFRTEYHITNNNEISISKSTNYQSSTSSSPNLIQMNIPSVTMASTYGQLVINDLQPGTYHDLLIEGKFFFHHF